MSYTQSGLQRASLEAIVAAKSEINVMAQFSHSFSDAVSEYGLGVRVPIIAATVSAFNESTFNMEDDSSSVTWKNIPVSSLIKGTYGASIVDCADTANSPYWDAAAVAIGEQIKKSVSDTFGGLFLSSEITATTSLTSVTKANIAKLRTQCIERVDDTVLLLDGQTYAEVIALCDSGVFGSAEPFRDAVIPKLFGFRAVGLLVGAADYVKGALVPSTAIGFASRLPVLPDGEFIDKQTAVDPDTGFAVASTLHYSRAKAKYYLNTMVLGGQALLKPDKIKLIV